MSGKPLRNESPNWHGSCPGSSPRRRIFEADEIRFHLARLEREQEAQELVSHDAENFDEDEVFSEDSETSAARARSFILIKQLLLAPQLGTS
jgi:hypothetical protein